MTKEELKSKILSVKNNLDDNKKEIKILNDKMEELIYIKEKLDASQDNLYHYRSTEKKKYQKVKETLPNIGFAVKFAEGMIEKLEGSESSKAHDNIEMSIQLTLNGKSRVKNQMQELKNMESKLEVTLTQLEYQLKQLESIAQTK